MRKLFLLLAALLLAFYAQTIWQSATALEAFVVRDGLLVALLAAFSFALGSGAVGYPVQQLLGQRLTAPGALVLYTGAACTLAGGLLIAVLPVGLGYRSGGILWWLGLLLLLISIGWRRAWQAQTVTSLTSNPPQARPPAGLAWLPLLFVTLIGVGVRLLVLSQLPTFCLGTECEGALALSGGATWLALPSPAMWLARALLPLTADPLFSLRLGVALLGMLTVAIFYLAAQPLAGRAAALLGTLLLALSPWHSATDGSSGPWITALLVFTLALWLWLAGYHRQQGRWALTAGLLLGLLVHTGLLGEASMVGWALLLWLLLLCLLASVVGEAQKLLGLALFLLGGFLVIALPALVIQWRTVTLANGLDSTSFSWIALLLTLFQQGILAANGWAAVPPLALGLGTFTLVGIGLLVRNLRHWLASWLLGGLVIFVILLRYTADPIALALLLLPALLTATLAVQQLFTTFQQRWQPLLYPTRTLAGATLLLLLFSAPALGRLLKQTESVSSTEQATLEMAMTRYLTNQSVNPPAQAIFAPASLLSSPSTRLGLDSLTLDILQPLGDTLNALYSATTLQDTLYLVPTTEGALLNLLQRLFPAALAERQLDPETGQPLFSSLLVTAAMQREQLGLPGLLWDGDAPATAPPTLALPTLTTLSPSWPPDLTFDRPFTARWQGTLRVPVAGAYNLTIDGGDPAHFVTFQVDQQLVLDSALGLINHSLTLAKGFYPIELTVRRPDALTPTPPAAFAIRWQRPDGIAEVIGGEYLSQLTPPDWGLIGEYYSGSEWQGTPLDLRKDPIIGLTTGLATPYSVRWQGKVATERTGEYLFAVLAAPTSIVQLTVDGVRLVDTTLFLANPALVNLDEEASGYAEGLLYLTAGWHDLEIHFAPDPAAPGLQLFWQPPGNGPTNLASEYLAPTPGVLAVDRRLPALPPTVNGTVGSAFALSQGVEYWKPQVRMPPTALPTLGLETQWRVGSCGNGLDQLNQPHGVAISAARQLIYVADTANRRVVEYGFDGQPKQSYQSVDWQEPFDIGLIDQSFPVLLDATTQLLYDLNPATGVIAVRPQSISFYRPRGLGIDDVGNLAVADTGGGRVAFLTGSGEAMGAIGGPDTAIGRGQPVDVATANGRQWAITAEDGRLWQLDGGGSIMAIQPTDTLNGPQLAATPGGALFVSDPARRVVLYLAATGQPLAFFAPPDLLLPTGIATTVVDDLLYLALVDSANCEIGLWRTPLTMLPTP